MTSTPSPHLSNDEFLTRLTTLFTTTHARAHGSVFITQKPLSDLPGAAGTDPDLTADGNEDEESDGDTMTGIENTSAGGASETTDIKGVKRKRMTRRWILVRATDGLTTTTTSSSSSSTAKSKSKLKPNSKPPPKPQKGGSGSGSGSSRQKTKLSTVVDLRTEKAGGVGFFPRFAEVCKAGMVEGMRKRDRRRAKGREKREKGGRKRGVKG